MLVYELLIFFKSWSVCAYDCFVNNNEYTTAVQYEYRRHFNTHRNQAVPTRKVILR